MRHNCCNGVCFRTRCRRAKSSKTSMNRTGTISQSSFPPETPSSVSSGGSSCKSSAATSPNGRPEKTKCLRLWSNKLGLKSGLRFPICLTRQWEGIPNAMGNNVGNGGSIHWTHRLRKGSGLCKKTWYWWRSKRNWETNGVKYPLIWMDALKTRLKTGSTRCLRRERKSSNSRIAGRKKRSIVRS